MSDQRTLYRINPEPHDDHDGSYTGGLPDPISFLVDDGVLVPVEPTEHQHQWLPWLTLPNGSSWTQCVPCGEQFQYDQR